MRGQESGYYQEQIGNFTRFFVRAPDQEGFEMVYSSVSKEG